MNINKRVFDLSLFLLAFVLPRQQYLDNKSNGIGGKAEITDPHDFALAFWKYFNNPALRIKHGKNGRENILKNYRWETLVRYFHSNILTKI